MISTTVRPTAAVSQETLSKIVRLRREVQEIESWATETRARLQAEEDQAIKALEDGLSIEPGERTASVKTITRRVVAWKDAFVKYLGITLAEKVSQETVPQVYKRLEIA